MKSGTIAFLALIFLVRMTQAQQLRDLKVDIQPFLAMGCVRVETKVVGEGDCSRTEYAHLECGLMNLTRFNCGRLAEVPAYYGGLNPKVAILECVFYGPWGQPANDGIRYIGAGMLPVYEKFLIYTDHGPQLINNSSEFKAFFAPVESDVEAFSYAAALTGSYPLYDVSIPPGYTKEAEEIRPTFVHNYLDGWMVHLFNYEVGGCGPHQYYSIDYYVSQAGEVKELKRENVWRNPKEDNLCVD